MKKLTLMTTVAVAMFAVPAMAGNNTHMMKSDHMMMKSDRMMRTDRGYDETVHVDVQNDPNMQVETQTRTRTQLVPSTRQEYVLENGQHIIVQGTAVYLANANGGWKYPAPAGDYYTNDGFIIVSDDGVWLRTEGPADTVYVDVDDRNRNGVPDRVRTY